MKIALPEKKDNRTTIRISPIKIFRMKQVVLKIKVFLRGGGKLYAVPGDACTKSRYPISVVVEVF